MSDGNRNPGAANAGGQKVEHTQRRSYNTKSAQTLAVDNYEVIKTVALSLIEHQWDEISTTFERWELCRRDQGYPGVLRAKMWLAILKARMSMGRPRMPDRKTTTRMKRELVRSYQRTYCGGCGKRADGATAH